MQLRGAGEGPIGSVSSAIESLFFLFSSFVFVVVGSVVVGCAVVVDGVGGLVVGGGIVGGKVSFNGASNILLPTFAPFFNVVVTVSNCLCKK